MEIVLLQRLSVYTVNWAQMIDVITFINCFLLSSLSLFLSVVLSKSPDLYNPPSVLKISPSGPSEK